MRYPYLLCLLALAMGQPTLSAQPLFEVNDDFPQEYINRLFAPGVAAVQSWQLSGGSSNAMQFTAYEDVDETFPVEEGLLFSTGPYNGTPWGNQVLNVNLSNTPTGNPSILALTQALTQGDAPTYDPVILRVTFRPLVDALKFRFAFASEEHPQYSCSQYNDLMGIFLEGPGYPSAFNLTYSPSGYPVGVFSTFCLDNNYWETTELMGFNAISQAMEFQAAVEICETYTLNIVLCDVSDAFYDSGVFMEPIRAERYNSVLAPTDLVYLEGCQSKDLAVVPAWYPEFSPVHYQFGGTATLGEDYTLGVPSGGTISAGGLFFKPEIVHDSVPDEGEYITLTLFGGPLGCQVQQSLLYYIAEIDSTEQTLCLPDSVPAFRTQAAQTAEFKNENDFAFANNFVSSPITTSGFPYAFLMRPHMIEQVCMNVESNFNNTLRLYLRSPQQAKLELSTNNGGSVGGLTNTCFSPYAEVDFTGIAPATGRFKPERNWASLGAPPTNGDWALMLKGGTNGLLRDWSMRFTKDFLYREFKYLWPDGQTTAFAQLGAGDSTEVLSVFLENQLMTMTVPVKISPKVPLLLNLNPTVCAGESVQLFGQQFDASNPSATLSLGECDTTVVVHLNLLPPLGDSLAQTLCQGESLQVGDLLFDAANPVGTVTLPSAAGCDSVLQVSLSFLPVLSQELEENRCVGDTLVVNGVAYTAQNPSGFSTISYANGCDSLLLSVKVAFWPTYSDTTWATIAPGQSYDFGGQIYSEPGVYAQYLSSVQGCDSTLWLVLEQVVGTSDTQANPLGLSLAPNPGSGKVLLLQGTAGASQSLEWAILDAGGRLVVAKGRGAELDFSHLPSGMYWVRAWSAEGVAVLKFLRN
jgi:hypothetical protein